MGDKADAMKLKKKNKKQKKEAMANSKWNELMRHVRSATTSYYGWENSLPPVINSDFNIEQYDWLTAYKISSAFDYSDFETYALFEDFELDYFGTQAEDFIAQCSFDGRDCSWSDFQTVHNPKYGNCFIFNSIYDQTHEFDSFVDSGGFKNGLFNVRNTSKTGRQFGLKLTLFLDSAENIGVLSQTMGAMVSIGAPYVPPLPTKNSITATAGAATVIAIRQEAILRKGGIYGNCIDEWPTFVALDTNYTNQWPRYDQSACEHYCIQAETFSQCGCVTDYYDGAPLCNPWNSTTRKCQVSIDKRYRDGDFTCDCKPACNDEFYSQEPSIAVWPNNQYTPYLIQRLRKYAEGFQIRKFLESILSNEAATVDLLSDRIRGNFSRVEIYFQNLNFEKI